MPITSNRLTKLKLTPAQWERILEGREGIALGPARRERARELRKRKKRMAGDAPSSTWFDAAWDQGESWPAGWIRCNICGRMSPPQMILSGGNCVDCLYCTMTDAQWTQLPSSPSGMAIFAARMMGVRLRF